MNSKRLANTVQKLLDGRITIEPESRDGQDGFRFRATGTIEELLTGVFSGHFGHIPILGEIRP